LETLVDVLKDPMRSRAVVADGVRMIDDEVHAKGGLSGLALKAGYKAVRTIKPTIIEEALGILLPEFAPAIDPFLTKGRAEGDVRAYFRRNDHAIANALLGVTDRKRKNSKNPIIRRAYDGLRPQAERLTAEAVPRLADMIVRHVK
jgi:hypothetical protein